MDPLLHGPGPELRRAEALVEIVAVANPGTVIRLTRRGKVQQPTNEAPDILTARVRGVSASTQATHGICPVARCILAIARNEHTKGVDAPGGPPIAPYGQDISSMGTHHNVVRGPAAR